MIGCWVVLAVAMPLAVPSLTVMSERNPVAILPADAPSTVTAKEISRTFKEAGSENVLVVLLTDDAGLGPADEKAYATLVDRLRQDNGDVQMLQDFISTPELRQVLASKDGKAWILPVGLAGELGTPESYSAYTRVSDIVRHTLSGTSLTAHLTGPASTVADLTVAGANDRLPIELAITILLLIILAVIYRNPATMMLPLVTIGASLLTAQGVVAAISLFTGLSISNQTIVFLSAMIAGAGTDYAVFLISRYHDYVRLGDDSDRAVQKALVSIGKVIAASAATVGVTFLGMGFAKLGVFSTVGVALAVAIAVAFLAAVTLLPAVLVLAGRRGWVGPRRELTARFWRHTAVRIVRRPARSLVASLVILLALAGCAGLVRFNYDDRKQLPGSADSSVGYAALERHFPVNETIPEYLFITSPQDLRTPRALADLEQMAQRVSQIPGIAMVRGVTRPTGESLEEARATYQAGQVGSQLGGASNLINGSTGDLNRLASGANQLAGGLGDVRGRVNMAIGSVGSLIDTLAAVQNQFGGGTTFGQFGDATKIIAGIRQLGQLIETSFQNYNPTFEWLDPVIASLNDSPVCNVNPVCVTARGQFVRLQTARDDGSLDKIVTLGKQLQDTGPLDKLSSSINSLSSTMQTATTALRKLGITDARSAKVQVGVVQKSANDLAGASQQIANGVTLLVDQTKRMGIGLDEASSFLMSMGQNASDPSMAGFNIPAEVLGTNDFRKMAALFISPDGHSVRYFVQTDLNPFSTQAMDQVNTILATAKGAQPNTTLADAKISMSGYPVTLRDTRDYYDHDITLIVSVTVIVVLLILMVLLRAVVAPLYLVGSVVISYLSALGIGVLFFQVILGQQLHWSVPGLAFVVLVAVGADYNMLLASRLREESGLGVRSGVIRTVRSTGGVITAAGLIFAASMFGLLFSSIGVVVQGGFVIGVGILVDTFLVRSITVPSIAALLGRASWWPSRPWEQQASADEPEEPRTVFDKV
ncbi:putative transport protein MmpL10 [Mycolicibacterium madagascariense]|uniref:Putative transport protein MmpL10 n=1 Tax=Mycolicibacterium madagascariense TaxID=212765 RepID=A0A7I7XBD6_9MYCO|nr:MMPL family transporter [Mycolicibacterium madagascariense]BBZ26253.1 putative transport protein MmpL10 [Mycolicibacterium madagascariense]